MASVLILGGCGFVGRNLVEYIKKNNLAKKVRVADKVLPELSGMSDEQKKMFKDDPVVEFKQASLNNQSGVDRAFADHKWDFVINLASETKYSQPENVYKESIVDIAGRALTAAKANGVKKWIELSTGQVYDAGKKASDETDKLKPWTKMAAAKLQTEEAVKASGIPFVILRAATIYGPGDITGVTPRIVCAATYTKTQETMTFLWDEDLRLHTVHVADVTSAIWHALTTDACAGQIYNLADKNDTSQGSIAKILSEVFGIKTEFMGTMKSKLATAVAMKVVAETANNTHMQPWSDLCKEKGITNSTLTPYLDEELLYNNSLSVNGAKIEGTGFKYAHPKMSKDLVLQSINYFVANKSFPAGITK